MKSGLPNSPVGLAGTAILGSLVACALFLAPSTFLHQIHGFAARMLLGIALLAIGFALYLKSISELKDGVRNQRWPEAQIAPLRRTVKLPIVTAFSIALLVAFALFEFLFTHFKGLGWACYLLSQTFLQLRNAFTPPRPKAPGSLIDWHTFAPIHSDQWGQR